jgi:hypothetical protein
MHIIDVLIFVSLLFDLFTRNDSFCRSLEENVVGIIREISQINIA